MHRRTLLHAICSTAGFTAVRNDATPATRPSRFQTADATELYFEDWGTGRPVVFVAPWALSSAWWEYQIAGLTAAGLRCITYDRRGHGRSDQPGRG
jgi:non-heme chloroperoxidase